MAQWLICPYFIAERRSLRDDADRLYQKDYQTTHIQVTNPTDRMGQIGLVFYDARGDGNYYRSDWAGGTLYVRPHHQRFYMPDPTPVFGFSFFSYGWFEIWLSLDEMTIDVNIHGLTRNMIGGGIDASAGGVVESRSHRTVHMVKKRPPLRFVLPEMLRRNPNLPPHFNIGNELVTTDRLNDDPFPSEPPEE